MSHQPRLDFFWAFRALCLFWTPAQGEEGPGVFSLAICLPQGLRVAGKFAHHNTCPAKRTAPDSVSIIYWTVTPRMWERSWGSVFCALIPSVWLGTEEAFYMLVEYMDEQISA